MRILLIAAAFFTIACHSSKKASSSTINEVEDSKQAEQKEMSPTSTEKNIRLVVTFASIGAGIDEKGKTMLDGYINSFKEKSGKLVKYGTLAWGREGEYDCEFSLNELNLNEQTDFVKGLKKLFEGNQLIQIEENKPSRFK
ncbi:MAG: hypothetical protein RL516_1315 [Bacteroidota bacterium]|jgi:hypothetical protein